MSTKILFFFIPGIILFVFFETMMGLKIIILPLLFFFCLFLVRPKFLFKSRYWEKILREKGYLLNALLALILMSAAFYIWYLCGTYIESTRGPSIPDIILDNLGPIDFGLIPIYLQRIAIGIVMAFSMFIWPTKLPFTIKATSLLIIVRSFCLVLTHLGLPAGRIGDELGLSHIEFVNFTRDLFFSGHVAFSFLGFLLFEKEKTLKYLLLLNSIILSFIVLAMHLHYSIDVVAAFFITYGTYKLATYFFKRDYELHRYYSPRGS